MLFRSTYAWVYPPPEFSQLVAPYPSLKDDYEVFRRSVWFQSTAYITADDLDWLPELFAKLTFLQPIGAERQVESVARLLNGTPDWSYPPDKDAPDQMDELREAAEALHREGQVPSRWLGSAEFAEISAR